MGTRPKIKVEQTNTDKLIEVIGWFALIVLWSLTLFNYSSLPGTIPIHFNASGQVDNYGSKSTIFVLPVIGTILFVGMTILTILNKHPHIFNYPVNITVENALKQYTTATRMIRYLKVVIVIVFTCLVGLIQTTATGKTSGLGSWFLPVTLAFILMPTTFFIFKSYKTK
jgi:uncharacterized membrane protein